MIAQQWPNRLCLGRFLNAVVNLKLLMGSPDSLDHTGAKLFYHRVVILAVAAGVLGPRLAPSDIASVMLLRMLCIPSSTPTRIDDEPAALPLDIAGREGPAGGSAHSQSNSVGSPGGLWGQPRTFQRRNNVNTGELFR